MSDKPTVTKPVVVHDGHQPINRGHQPAAKPAGGKVTGGHQPTTGQGGSGPGTPPNQGSGGKK